MLNPVIQQQGEVVQKFCEQDARKLVEDMLFLYGKKFTDQWSGLKKSQIVAKLVERLSGITFKEFQRGLNRLDTAEWPPTIPEFKNWCLGKYEHQSKEDAWLQALAYEQNNRSYVINKFAKQAFDEVVKPYGHLGSTDTFYRVFCSVYVRITTEAKERNEPDTVLDAVPQCGHSGETGHQPVSNDIAKQQLENLKKRLNVKNRVVEQPQKLAVEKQPEQLENFWLDPFDHPEAYLKACEVDGVKVPNAIRDLLGGSQ